MLVPIVLCIYVAITQPQQITGSMLFLAISLSIVSGIGSALGVEDLLEKRY